jgi:hypothetical protein
VVHFPRGLDFLEAGGDSKSSLQQRLNIKKAMEDKGNKEFVCRLNGRSIWWSSRYARKDRERFIIRKDGRQEYDTEDLSGAIEHALDGGEITPRQRIKMVEYAKQFDPMSVNEIKAMG